jgi:hypothetical protein
MTFYWTYLLDVLPNAILDDHVARTLEVGTVTCQPKQ